MKKRIISLLVIALFCLVSVAAASSNPFSDVPANHWSYDALSKLAKAGIIDGYVDGTFRGDKTMTRYEMAKIVATAVDNESKANAENKALIEKLAKEFADELQQMGKRVDKLEKDADKFHYFGIMGNRYDHWDKGGITDKSNVFILNTFYKINDNFTAITQNEMHRMFLQTAENQSGNNNGVFPNTKADWNNFGLQSYVDGKFDGFSTKLGRFTYMPAYGISHGDYMEISGFQLTFGNHVKTTLVAGQDTEYVPGGTFASMGYRAADVVVPVSPNANIKVAYQSNQSNLGLAPSAAYVYGGLLHNNDYINYLESGFDTKLGQDLSLEAAYIKSTYDDSNKGCYTQIKYKNAIPFVANTYDFFVTYHNLQANSIMYNDLRYYPNLKGVRVGFHYAPWQNTLLTVWYDMQKYINDGMGAENSSLVVKTNEKDNFFRAQFDLFFK